MNQQSSIEVGNPVEYIMASVGGELIARSWLEKPILSALEHWFFPLSRLWAAARVAEGDPERFFAAVPMPPQENLRPLVQKLLDGFTRKRDQIHATEERWREVFFGAGVGTAAGGVSQSKLQELEQTRRDHRSQYNATRRGFSKLRKYVRTSVYNNFAVPQTLQQLYGQNAAEFAALFAPPESLPEVERSHAIDSGISRDYWIRFPSPSRRLQDMVYARVLEPLGIANPPTIVFGHGIGVEFDHWRNLVDIVTYFPRLGIRVIRPESPWHGRRVPDGYYGGEYFLSSSPLGSFDFFTAQHQEWAVMMHWARQTSNGPLAIGGSSLGAQSAQMTAIRANAWGPVYQPDALFLMTHCAHIWEVALDGALADIWGLHQPLQQKGWNRQLTESWLQKLDPAGEPCMPADCIVSVLGKTDMVTPFRSGKRMQQHWNLPEQNCFHWPCGHFSIPLRMVRHHQPMRRLQDILKRLQ